MLSERATNDFINVYFKIYGVKLKEIEANEMAIDFLQFFKLIYRPIPKEFETNKN